MQKYTIFNKYSKILLIKTSKEEDLKDYQRIINCDNETFDKEDLDIVFSENGTTNTVFVCNSLSLEEVFARLTKNLYHVFAAGGIVENENKDLLFMYRSGYWDLPKGHWESGESLPFTAKREVMEETGINHLEITDFIGISYHTYYMYGRHELKHIYWYKMKTSSTETLLPQTEEGIKELKWIRRENLGEILKQSYPNIRNIFAMQEL